MTAMLYSLETSGYIEEIVHSSRSLGTSTEVDIYKFMCEILIIFNKCLNVGSLELGDTN
jgi:hypothetical protein